MTMMKSEMSTLPRAARDKGERKMGIDWSSEGARLTAEAIKTTTKFLPAPYYEIKLIPEGENVGPIITRHIRRHRFPDYVRFLRGKNAEGYHVYFRPEARQFIYVDDVCMDDIDFMKEDGIRPVLVYETSEENLQAWVQLANRSEHLTDQEATEARKILAKLYSGDRGATGTNQLGRLPGFRNLKPMHEDAYGGHPLVIIKRATFTSNASRLLDEAREMIANSPTLPPNPLGSVLSNSSIEIDPTASKMTPEEGREIYDSTTTDLADRFDWQLPITKGHRSNADFAVARCLILKWNFKPNDVASVLMHGSDKAAERGIDYVIRTVKVAMPKDGTSKIYSGISVPII